MEGPRRYAISPSVSALRRHLHRCAPGRIRWQLTTPKPVFRRLIRRLQQHPAECSRAPQILCPRQRVCGRQFEQLRQRRRRAQPVGEQQPPRARACRGSSATVPHRTRSSLRSAPACPASRSAPDRRLPGAVDDDRARVGRIVSGSSPARRIDEPLAPQPIITGAIRAARGRERPHPVRKALEPAVVLRVDPRPCVTGNISTLPATISTSAKRGRDDGRPKSTTPAHRSAGYCGLASPSCFFATDR